MAAPLVVVVRFVDVELLSSPPLTAVGGPAVGTRTDVGVSTVGGAAFGRENPVGVMDGTSDGASLSNGITPPGGEGTASKVGRALGASFSSAAGAADGGVTSDAGATDGRATVGMSPGPAEGGRGVAAVGAEGAAGASLDAGDADAEGAAGGTKIESSSVALEDGAGVPGEGGDGATCDGGLTNSRLFSSTVVETTVATSSSSQYLPGAKEVDAEQSHDHPPPSWARTHNPPL
jgi:hypothetical protein